MVQAKVNRELARTDMSEGYTTCSNSKINSVIKVAEETNVLPSQTIASDENEEALAGAATILNLLSPPTYNLTSLNLSQSLVRIKCYYPHTDFYFLDYLNDTIPDDAVIYASDIAFQYNKIEDRYTTFIGNPIGTVFIAAKRDHKFLFSQRSNKPIMSNNSINFGPFNTNEKCSNFIQVAPANISDSLQYISHLEVRC